MSGIIDQASLITLTGMGLVTYGTRLSGFYLLKGLKLRGRMKAALDALPPAILMAVIAPTVLLSGPAEMIAGALTALSAYLRLPLVITIIVGVASVVALRHVFA